MRYAETGYNLEIDLATGNIERVETDPKLFGTVSGRTRHERQDTLGQGSCGNKPFDPENLLIFSAGLLCGTPLSAVIERWLPPFLPQSELLAYPMMGGFWAAELKYAGYDKVNIEKQIT